MSSSGGVGSKPGSIGAPQLGGPQGAPTAEEAEAALFGAPETTGFGEGVAGAHGKKPTGAPKKTGGGGEIGAKAGASASDPLMPPDYGQPVTIEGCSSANASVSAVNGSSAEDSMIGALFALGKAAIEDRNQMRQFSTAMKTLALDAKAAKLKMDNKSIQEGMNESREKAQNLMDAANIGLITGICAGMCQMAGGIAGAATSGAADSTKALWSGIGTALNGAADTLKSIGSFYGQMAQADNLMIDANSQSQKTKMAANNQQIIADGLQAMADKADEGKKGADDHLRAVKDAIKKFIEQMVEIERNTKIS